MGILLILYLLQTILGYLFWTRVLSSKSKKIIEKVTYLFLSMIILPNLIFIVAMILSGYYKIKTKIRLKYFVKLKNNTYICKTKIHN